MEWLRSILSDDDRIEFDPGGRSVLIVSGIGIVQALIGIMVAGACIPIGVPGEFKQVFDPALSWMDRIFSGFSAALIVFFFVAGLVLIGGRLWARIDLAACTSHRQFRMFGIPVWSRLESFAHCRTIDVVKKVRRGKGGPLISYALLARSHGAESPDVMIYRWFEDCEDAQTVGRAVEASLTKGMQTPHQ